MRLAIIGLGSVGLLFSSRLVTSRNLDCTLVTRRINQARTLNEKGLTAVELNGRAYTYSCSAVSLDEWSGSADWALVFVKQPQLPALLRRLQEKKVFPARFLLFQNGLGHVEQVKAMFPDKPVYVAVTSEGAMRQDDTTVRHTGSGVTWLGAADDDEGVSDEIGRTELQRLLKILRDHGMDVRITDRIQARMWEKWVINCAINPLTGILGVPNGALCQCAELQSLALEAAEEAVRVAQVCGIPLDMDELRRRVLEVCEKTAANRSSMLQDVLHRRETEIEALTGHLLQLAAQRQVSVPVSRVLYRLLKTVEVLGVHRPIW